MYRSDIYWIDSLVAAVHSAAVNEDPDTMHVKTLCLGALCLGDATGYDIKKLFEAAFNHFHHASFGSIYPALKQLEKEGFVSCRVEPGSRHPTRNLYSATDEGRAEFTTALAGTEPKEDVRSEFLVLLFFAHLLPTDILEQKLDQVEQRYESQLAYLEMLGRESDTTAGIRLTIEIGIAASRAKLDTLRRHRDALLERHRDMPASWTESDSCTA